MKLAFRIRNDSCLLKSFPKQFPKLFTNSNHLITSFSRSNVVKVCQPNFRHPNNQQWRFTYRQTRKIWVDHWTNHRSSNKPNRRCPHHPTRRRFWHHPEYTCQNLQGINLSQSDGPRPERTGRTSPQKYFRWKQAKWGKVSARVWGNAPRNEKLQLSRSQIRRARSA